MSSREREIKLAASPAFRMPPLTDPGGDVFAGPDETLVLDATYYDTDDLRLARSGATLRHRSDQGWLVKLPAGTGNDVITRDEHDFAGGPSAPPETALDLVRSLIRSAEVASVARLRTNRHRVPLHDADGKPIAEVVDDEVDVLEGPDDVAHFREIEVELTDTISDAQRSVVLARLRAAGAGVADPTPKLVHALGPRASAPPDVVVEEVTDATVDAVVRHSIGAAVAKLVAHDPGVRLGDDPEDVHQARVATRRLRSHLRTFSSLVDEAWANELRDELRWLGDVLGGVRDADVLLGRLESHVVRLPSPDRRAAERLLDTLRSDRDRRRTPLLQALRSDRYTALLDALVRGAQRPRLLLRIDDEPDSEVLRKLVSRPWTHLRNAVEALDDEPPIQRCTRCESASSGRATPPRPSKRRSASRPEHSPARSPKRRTCWASTRTRSSPPNGSGARPRGRTTNRSASPRDSSPQSNTSTPWPHEPRGRKRGSAPARAGCATGCERIQDAKRRTGKTTARRRRPSPRSEPLAASSTAACAARSVGGCASTSRSRSSTAPLRRLELPEGQAGTRRERRGDRAAGGARGDGLHLHLGPDLGEIRYRDSKGRQKLVRYWAMNLLPDENGEDFVPNREVDVLRWCRPAEADRLLSYEHDRVLLDRLKQSRSS